VTGVTDFVLILCYVHSFFVRHTPGYKWAGEEFAKSCKCRKHFRWSQDGKQFRRKAGTRSWAEAEEIKRGLDDQLAGRARTDPKEGTRTLADAIEVFKADKKIRASLRTSLITPVSWTGSRRLRGRGASLR